MSEKNGFAAGDLVVYPTHGVGKILGIETQEIAGYTLNVFVVHFDKTGAADRIVIRKLGCGEAESVIGGAVKVLVVDQGAFRSTGENQTGWYQGQVSFSYS